MGQIEIFEILKGRRLAGDDRFFTVKQIRNMLRSVGKNENCKTGIQCAQLEAFGYLEAQQQRRKHDHFRAWRIKIAYMENKEKV